jgi:hypothetical protein
MASNGQIDSATEPGCRQNRRRSQSADEAGVMSYFKIIDDCREARISTFILPLLKKYRVAQKEWDIFGF